MTQAFQLSKPLPIQQSTLVLSLLTHILQCPAVFRLWQSFPENAEIIFPTKNILDLLKAEL